MQEDRKARIGWPLLAKLGERGLIRYQSPSFTFPLTKPLTFEQPKLYARVLALLVQHRICGLKNGYRDEDKRKRSPLILTLLISIMSL